MTKVIYLEECANTMTFVPYVHPNVAVSVEGAERHLFIVLGSRGAVYVCVGGRGGGIVKVD